MAEQALDVRSAISVLRRGRTVLAGAAAVGAFLGIGWVLLNPPMYTSTATVLLPPATDADGKTVGRDVATEIRVAESDVVMGAAARNLTPTTSVRTLLRLVEVEAPTMNVLEFTARAHTARAAEILAQTVADAEVAHYQQAASSLTSAQVAFLKERQRQLEDSFDTVTAEMEATSARIEGEDPTSVQGKADAAALAQLTAEQANLVLQVDDVKGQVAGSAPGTGATVIQEASPGRRPAPAGTYGLAALIGVAGCLALVALALLVIGRRDRRLRFRDEIADAVGRSVAASIRSRVPHTVAGWVSLLAGYAPGPVEAWALRQTLHQLQLVPGDAASGHSAPGVEVGYDNDDRGTRTRTVTVITMAGDARALAIGPQLASYAASAGLRSRLVPALRHEAAAALWAACARVATGGEVRPGLVVHTRDPGDDTWAMLTVLLVVADRRSPVLTDLPASDATILAVSAGSATAEDLARVAIHAHEAGGSIDAVVVADPDNLDRTTGRLLQRERAQQPMLPARMTGGVRVPPGSNVAALRRRRRP